MHAAAVRTLAVAGIAGAIAGLPVAFVGQWWTVRDVPSEFSYASYTSTPDEFTPRFGLASGWFDLLWPAAAAGFVVAAVIALMVTVRRRGTPAPGGLRGLVLAAGGALLGLAVGGALYLHADVGATDDVVYHGRYVALSGVTMRPYESSLRLDFDTDPNLFGLLAVCGAVGLAIGLVAGATQSVIRRRR